MTRIVIPNRGPQLSTRRDVLRGATGIVAGGALALVSARGGSFSALAQDATPAAGVDVYPEVVYVGAEYSFTGPAEVAAGLTRLTLRNEGQMDHHMMVVKFNEGKSVADLPAAMAAGLPGLFELGVSIGGPGGTGPGQQATVIYDLAEGNYILICVIPDEDGIPHVAKGMALPITVTAGTGTAAAPQADASIAMMDFHFSGLPATVTPGQHIWEITNQAQQLHEIVVLQLAPGVTYEQIEAIFSAPPAATPMAGMGESTPMAAQAGQPPFTSITGTAPASPGTQGWLVLDLAAGEYVAICFVPDAQTGAPHFALGMISPFTVA
jgi:hypothetical protein